MGQISVGGFLSSRNPTKVSVLTTKAGLGDGRAVFLANWRMGRKSSEEEPKSSRWTNQNGFRVTDGCGRACAARTRLCGRICAEQLREGGTERTVTTNKDTKAAFLPVLFIVLLFFRK